MSLLFHNALFVDGVKDEVFTKTFTEHFLFNFLTLPKQTNDYSFTYTPLKKESGIFLEAFFISDKQLLDEQVSELSLRYPTLSFDLYYYEENFQVAGNYYIQNGHFYMRDEFHLGQRYLWKFIKNTLEDAFNKTIIQLET